MKKFIEAFKIAVLDFFSGKSENESVNEMRLDENGNIIYIHSKLKETSPQGNIGIGESITNNSLISDVCSSGIEPLPLASPKMLPKMDNKKEEPKHTFIIFPKPKVLKENKINKVSNKKVKTKSKPKKILNITIIHNKKPITITEFSKISGIPYPVIKYHYYINKIKTSKELKKHLKPETLEKAKVKL